MFNHWREGFLSAVIVTLAGAGVATATPTCQGSFSTALLAPLPAHAVVGLDVRDRSPRNLERAQRFLAGVRSAGVAVADTPNIMLHVSSSRLGEVETWTNRGAVQSTTELPGLQGGLQPVLPPIPSQGLGVPRSPPPPPLLFVRIDARASDSTRIAWVASVQCQMTGLDEGQLSEDLGRLVGKTLGQRTEQRPF